VYETVEEKVSERLGFLSEQKFRSFTILAGTALCKTVV
jgi:hypothetical protein